VFVERAPAAVAAIRRNLVATKLDARGRVVASAVATFLGGNEPPGAPYDLVFCDPPYDLGPPELDEVLGGVDGLLDEGSTVVLTRGHKSSTGVIPLHWTTARQLRYGDSLVFVFRPRGPI
jgi:16S rRNA (guanine966-N2)-methyltransferase